MGEASKGTEGVLRQRFSENLVKARERSGLTQEELANMCGIHRTEVSLLEREGREPRLGTLTKLAAALGVPREELCAGIEWDVKRHRFRLKRSA